MRKPNGYGTIKKLAGNRRRPYVFVISENGKQKAIEYFSSALDAEIFQADYNRQRGKILASRTVTFAELFQRWLARHIQDTSPSQSAITGYYNSFRHFNALHEVPFNKLKYADYQQIIDLMHRRGLSYSSLKKARSLISLMSKYAAKIELSSKNYAPLLSIGRNKPVRKHRTFTRQLINRVWKISDYHGADAVLILLYTGMRVGELLNLKKCEINMHKRLIHITQSKTESGIRIIPIHHLIERFISARMQASGDYLICNEDGMRYNYARFCTLWDNVMKQVNGRRHTTHDCRHTVATLLDNANANETAKRRILGHAGGDVTERIYTHKGLRQLRRCIELLK